MRNTALKTLWLGGFALSFALAATACAQTPAAPHINYRWVQDPSLSPSYDAARTAMDKDNIFKNSRYKRGPDGINPGLNIGESNLDRDPLPEIIAAPTEDEPEVGLICEKGFEFICPHYILDGVNHKLIGIIKADRVDRGPEIKNGYWTLVGTFENESKDKKEDDNLLIHKVDTYEFNKGKGSYEKVKTEFVSPPQPAPTAEPK